MNKNCIVLLSGGQDSATVLFWAKQNFDKVIAVSFNYGQKHAVELEYATKLAMEARVDLHHVFDMTSAKMLTGSSLVDKGRSHNLSHSKDKSLPASFTPGRNALFLTIAASFGYNFEAFDLVTGVCQTDFSGYPDCRRVFIDAITTSLSLAMGKDFRIHTPLMYLDKADTWKMAMDFGPEVFETIRTQTMTDYNGDETENYWGKGKTDNPASDLRKKGFDEFIKRYYDEYQEVIEKIPGIMKLGI